jgi:hypothetical protein
LSGHARELLELALVKLESSDALKLGHAPELGDDYGTHRMTIVRAVGSARILEILSLDPDDVLAGCSRTVATGGVD